MATIQLKQFTFGRGHPLTLISGPCVIESEEHSLAMARHLKAICSDMGVPFIFKSSYDKANRSSYSSFRGPGLKEGLRILERVKHEVGVPVTTDVHTVEEATAAGQICDIIQIPAFLCRQTDLIMAAARTPAVVNVKKGQFMAPADTQNIIAKVREAGKSEVILTERGTTFGYNNLVCDMRGIEIMQQLGAVICFDATHAVQLPGGNGQSSGGDRRYIPVLARAAVAAGADCLFMESHDRPNDAKSDRDSVLDIADLPELLKTLLALYAARGF